MLLENWLDEQNFSNVSERLKIQNSVASECKLNVTLLQKRYLQDINFREIENDDFLGLVT